MEIKEVRHYNIPIFIPELGCPHQCIFCNQNKITGQNKMPEKEEVIEIIETYLTTIKAEESNVEVAFFGGNFTGIGKSQQEKYLSIVTPYIKEKKIKGIRISTRPDYISTDILEMLKNYNVSSIELGAQSFDNQVLSKSGRGHTKEDTIKAARLIKKFEFMLGLQMMLGLPGDNKEKSINTAQKIIELKADTTRIYPALIIKDTKLEKYYREGFFTPLSINEAVNIAKKLFLLFEKNNIKILKVGLHPSEGLLEGDELIAGPFHRSFRELVLTSVWKDIWEQTEFEKREFVKITVPKSEYNYAIGYKASNKIILEKRFKKVKFISDNFLEKRNFYADYS